MEMNQTKEFLLEEMREGIDKVITGELDDYSNELLAPQHAIDYLRELGSQEINDGDNNINGWEADAWYYEDLNGTRYCMQGSGYNGGLRVYIDDESGEDEEESPYTNGEED